MHHHLMTNLSFTGFFLMGFFGSVHCMGMCGPLSVIILSQKEQQPSPLLTLVTYHLSRLLIYSFLGFLFAYLGKTIQSLIPKELFIVIFGFLTLAIIFTHLTTPPINGFNVVIRNFIQKVGRLPSLITAISMGLLTPLLPCGLLYAALSMSFMLGSPLHASVAMLLFALGTAFPMALVQVGLQKTIGRSSIYANVFTKVIAVSSLLLSIYFLYRH